MKLQSNKKFILGVCSGLSEHHNLNVNLFRILFLATGFLFGVGVFMYLLMWYLLRKEKNNLPQLKFGLIGNSNWWFVSMISLVFGIVIFYLFPSITGDFWNDTDILKFADLSRYNLNLELVKFKEQVINFRIGLFKEDVLRSLLFVSLAVALLISFQKYKINHYLVLGLLLLIVSVDNIKVSQRYFNNDKVDPSVDLSAQTNVINEAIKSGLIDKTEANNYLDKYEFKELSQIPIFSPTIADIGILSQERSTILDFESKKKEFISKMENIDFYNNGSTPKTKEILAEYAVLNLNSNYRVYRLGNAFVETQTSYYHKSIGGYHGAKLKRFQEFIDFYINTTTDTSLIKNLGNYMISENTVDLPKKYQALNMLNTKYLNINSYVQNPQDAIKNNSAYGNAWFVSSIKKVKSANDEMTGIASIDTKTEAIVNVNDFDFLSKKSFSQIDPNSSIKMTKYDVNKIVYESNASKEQAAIFSEIWYPDGWNCYIDGNMTDELFRANYILRGAIIPAGKHTIEWRFEPESFKKASNYSKYGSILLFLFIFGAIGFESYKKFKGKKE